MSLPVLSRIFLVSVSMTAWHSCLQLFRYAKNRDETALVSGDHNVFWMNVAKRWGKVKSLLDCYLRMVLIYLSISCSMLC